MYPVHGKITRVLPYAKIDWDHPTPRKCLRTLGFGDAWVCGVVLGRTCDCTCGEFTSRSDEKPLMNLIIMLSFNSCEGTPTHRRMVRHKLTHRAASLLIKGRRTAWIRDHMQASLHGHGLAERSTAPKPSVRHESLATKTSVIERLLDPYFRLGTSVMR